MADDAASATATDFATSGVSVVIPAYNEEGAIEAQVRTVAEALANVPGPSEILVVDDGSSDRTLEHLKGLDVRVLQHLENRGYGAALKTGFAAARYDRVVIIDADGTYPAHAIPELLRQLEHADMVIAARTGRNVHIPLIRRPAKWVLQHLAQRVAGRRIPDLNSGLRAFWKPCLQQYYAILPDGFSLTTTITLAMIADGYRLLYHPIDYERRVGKSKIVARHFMDFMILVVRITVMFHPLKVFIPLAAACGGLGSAKVLFDLLAVIPRNQDLSWSLAYQEVFSTSAIFLLLVAVQILLIGMATDGMIRRLAQRGRPLVSSRAVLDLSTEDALPDGAR